MEQNLSIEERLNRFETIELFHKTVLNFNELVRYTGLSSHYLYKLTSQGKIPFSKPCGKIMFFEKAKIDAWLLQNPSKSLSEIQSEAATYLTRKKK
ncbi:MAG: helix-turn-helix domain-containing protein [Flavipsychrobacter sp.]|nr:helix-turn-helix domain-containing protein [Flavipsychrobacter sp.]